MLHVNFKTYGSYVTDSLYQWDLNQDLIINGLDLIEAPEIHFANANMDRAIVKQSMLDEGVITVQIPNSLLQEALTIKVFIGMYDEDAFNVIETVEIPVIAKTRPLDYELTDSDEEIYSFKALEYMLARALETMELTKKYIEENLEDTGNTYTLLWENPDPTAVFASQDIVLGSSVMSKYEEFLITYNNTRGVSNAPYYVLVENHKSFDGAYKVAEMIDFSFLYGFLTPIVRSVNTQGDDCIRIHNATHFLNTGEIVTDNGYLIPGKIYGVKAKTLTISEEEMEKAVIKYLRENPIVGGTSTSARIGEVRLSANSWVGSGNLYSQVVNIDGITENSQVDLTPNVNQLVVFYEKDLTLVTENVGGVVTVYAIGQKPEFDYTIQVTITEVL